MTICLKLCVESASNLLANLRTFKKKKYENFLEHCFYYEIGGGFLFLQACLYLRMRDNFLSYFSTKTYVVGTQ